MNQNEITILVVDDDSDMRTNVIKAIGEKEFIFLQAEDDQALRDVLNSQLVDVIVLDLRMPTNEPNRRFLNFVGLESLRFINNTHPKIPVIIFSAVPGKALQDDANQLGAFRFIEKSESDLASRQLRESIREAIFTRYGFHPTSTKTEVDLPHLTDLISQVFNLDEFQDLCMRLGILYDTLGGTNLNGKARELVAYFERRQDLSRLITACISLRPNSPWPQE